MCKCSILITQQTEKVKVTVTPTMDKTCTKPHCITIPDSNVRTKNHTIILYSSVSQPPGCERPEETTICYKISLVQLITNLNVILYLSTCHTLYISVLIFFIIMPSLIINTYVSLMYELKKKIESYLRVNLLGPGPPLTKKKEFTRPRSHRS